MKKKLGIGAAIVAGLFVVMGLLGAGDIIDLPAWANIPGVDIPVVGDKDAIDCKLTQVAATDDSVRVEIRIVDGNKDSYGNYIHVWNNGNLLTEDAVVRDTDDLLVVIPNNEEAEQFFSISVTPFREGRVFCESIVIS